jgi:putative heme-binding domain-containing protein
LQTIGDNNARLSERLNYIRILGEVAEPEAMPALLDVVEGSSSGALKQGALLALQNYDSDEAGLRVVKAYPDRLRDDYDVRESAMAFFSSRPAWSLQLLDAITKTHAIDRSDVPEHTIRQMKLLGKKELNEGCDRLWPQMRPATAEEKNKTVERVAALAKTPGGDEKMGHPLFIAKCGTCHKLFSEGRSIAPDLTGYDRKNIADFSSNIVDPSAYIREGYGTWHLTTVDGRTVIGTLRSKTDQAVTIQPFTGEPVTLAGNRIKSLEAMDISMMPEKLLDDLSDKQVKDLFSYIMK